MIIALDARRFQERESAHEYLKEQFSFPDYYGHNLDALYDLLSEPNDYEVEIEHAQEAGAYFTLVLDVLEEAGIPFVEPSDMEE